MTPRSDPDNKWYDKSDMLPNDNYVLAQTFSDSEIKIMIYEKK